MKDNSNITQDLLERIERYYNDTMPNDEREAFGNKLQSDEAFKTQVEDVKTLLLGIETQSLKEQMDVFHLDVPEPTTISKSSKIKLLNFAKYAVAAILVIALGRYWFFGTPTNEKLYAKYYTPDPGLPTTMSASDNFEFYDAMVNYKHGDYKIAISKWKKIQQKKPTNDTINYFLAAAYMANNNIENAIPLFKITTNKFKSAFKNDANFYLGLAYLKTNNKEQAIKYLKLNHSEKSNELLDKLK
ncbi:tetratricopeptide repeat protein [Mariniflexile sp.]|uniref:tetratricopeptide repeat protein n=1 Tax=Mariniflexile sp. TaxID=1979402 RepID=UPI0040488CF1